jgi:hypothetical protein
MSYKVIAQVLFQGNQISSLRDIQPKTEIGVWFNDKPKREGFSKVKYVEFHNEYKSQEEYEANKDTFVQNLIFGLTQLGLPEKDAREKPVKYIENSYPERKTPTYRDWKKQKSN